MQISNPELHRKRVSQSLVGKFGEQSRRWKGENAGYVAIHLWIKKHWGLADHCDMCHSKSAKRYEWCNLDKKYKRNREEWVQLCPSCHRIYDCAFIREQIYGANACVNGHIRTVENTYINPRGHKQCRICRTIAFRRYKNAKANKV